MILSHFTADKQFKFDPSVKYTVNKVRSAYFKPTGLWLSDEKDYGWKQWCEDEEFNLDSLKHRIEFKVNTKNVLILNKPSELKDFTKKYIFSPFPSQSSVEEMEISWINWERVQKDYSGIIITPYQWDLRLCFEYHWYYGWDCASGCIWDLSKLEVIN